MRFIFLTIFVFVFETAVGQSRCGEWIMSIRLYKMHLGKPKKINFDSNLRIYYVTKTDTSEIKFVNDYLEYSLKTTQPEGEILVESDEFEVYSQKIVMPDILCDELRIFEVKLRKKKK